MGLMKMKPVPAPGARKQVSKALYLTLLSKQGQNCSLCSHWVCNDHRIMMQMAMGGVACNLDDKLQARLLQAGMTSLQHASHCWPLTFATFSTKA